MVMTPGARVNARRAERFAHQWAPEVVRLREQDLTYQEIADHFNQEGVQTRRGGRWYSATVKRVEKYAGRPPTPETPEPEPPRELSKPHGVKRAFQF